MAGSLFCNGASRGTAWRRRADSTGLTPLSLAAQGALQQRGPSRQRAQEQQQCGCRAAAAAAGSGSVLLVDAAPAAAAAATDGLLVAAPPQPGSPVPQLPDDQLLLRDVRVVLVAPKHAANVGAVARCCANFECMQLVVVAPRCDAAGDEAWKVACGDAVLDRMVIVDSLEQALGDTTSSVGFTRRAGATRVTAASLAHLLLEFPWVLGGDAASNGGTTTALVFGREESGLTEAELRLCRCGWAWALLWHASFHALTHMSRTLAHTRASWQLCVCVCVCLPCAAHCTACMLRPDVQCSDACA